MVSIDDFLLSFENGSLLDKFRTRLSKAFEGTKQGAANHYLGCQIERDMKAGTVILSQKPMPKKCSALSIIRYSALPCTDAAKYTL